MQEDRQQRKKIQIRNVSNQQQRIIKMIQKGFNIFSDSVPGAGKTHTILSIAQHTDKNILQVTYNRNLCQEVSKKVKQQSIQNLHVYTYHGLACRYYDNCYNNVHMSNIIKNNINIKFADKYDIIIIDECQDMSEIYYRFITKFIRDTYSGMYFPQMLFLGDSKQSIYKFMGADSRYLSLCDKIFNIQTIPIQLTQTFRMPNKIVDFVNDYLLGYKRMFTTKQHERQVQYFDQNPRDSIEYIADYIELCLRRQIYKPSDIFVLCTSLQQQSTKGLMDILIKKRIDGTLFAIEDGSNDCKDINEDKIIFTTFHKSKGRERKLVIVFNFDESYFYYYNKEFFKQYIDNQGNIDTQQECPNEIYVACTRALQELILVKSVFQRPFGFLKKTVQQNDTINYICTDKYSSDWLRKIADKNLQQFIQNNIYTNVSETIQNNQQNMVSVTQLIKFIQDKYQVELQQLIDNLFEEIIPVQVKSNIETTTDALFDSKEIVSDLTGQLIPIMYMEKNYQKEFMINLIREYIEIYIQNGQIGIRLTGLSNRTHSQKMNSRIRTQVVLEFVRSNFQLKNDEIHIVLDDQMWQKLICLYGYLQGSYGHKIYQITNYSWIEKANKEIAFQNLDQLHLKNPVMEYRVEHEMTTQYGQKKIIGIIDCIDENNVYEFKYTNELTIDHKLQLLCYYYVTQWNKDYSLFNINTRQLFRLRKNDRSIQRVMQILIDNKFEQRQNSNDQEFIQQHLDILQEIDLQ